MSSYRKYAVENLEVRSNPLLLSFILENEYVHVICIWNIQLNDVYVLGCIWIIKLNWMHAKYMIFMKTKRFTGDCIWLKANNMHNAYNAISVLPTPKSRLSSEIVVPHATCQYPNGKRKKNGTDHELYWVTLFSLWIFFWSIFLNFHFLFVQEIPSPVIRAIRSTFTTSWCVEIKTSEKSFKIVYLT